MSNNANLHIPTALIKNYDLSGIALLVYGELNGLYSKHKQCFITDKALSERLNRSIASIQKAIHKLKNHGLIISKQKPNFKGRIITVPPLNAKKFLLIPVVVIQQNDLSTGAMLLYGSLYSRQKKLAKINADKHQENAPLVICATKSELADELQKTSRAIRYQLKELEKHKYINLISNKGINIAITLIPVKLLEKARSNIGTTDNRDPNNLCKKRASTYEKNEYQPMKKASIDLCKKRATNRTLIKINKEKGFSFNKDQRGTVDPFNINNPLSKPPYNFSIPNDNDAPPIPKDESNELDADLNELDQRSTQQTKTTGTGNTTSRNASNAPKPKQQKSQYEPYNGFNLEYQAKQLKNMLNTKTGKRYIITRQKSLIEQRLKDGFTLYDFENAIDYLIQHQQAISLNDLIAHLPDYLNKINSN